MDFKVVSAFEPSGDQPQAIEKLANGVIDGLKGQILKLENNHKNTQHLHNLLNEIRQIEMSAR